MIEMVGQHMPDDEKRERGEKFYRVLNAVLLMFFIAGLVVMIGSLTIAITSIVKNHYQVANMLPQPTPTNTLSNVEVTETRNYHFNTAKDLKAFKITGGGAVTISKGHRMMIRTLPGGIQRVRLTIQVDGDSTVRFDDQVSSEEKFDFARFDIDGQEMFAASGQETGNAKYQVYPLDPGEHVLTWSYSKDTTVAKYADRYYVDNITITHVFTKAWLDG